MVPRGVAGNSKASTNPLQRGGLTIIASTTGFGDAEGGKTDALMKQIQKGELYEHLSGFLKNKGIELTSGSYSQTIQKTCGLLTDTINLSQQGIERARQGLDEKVDRVRQVIHEKTAPTPGTSTTPGPALRRGVGRVQFISASYDSILGQFFQPLTNTYSMVMITNSQQVTEYYQRVVTGPDFLFQTADLTVPNGGFPYGSQLYNVTAPNFDQSTIINNLAGPGTIVPGAQITFNKNINSLYLNGSLNVYGYSTNAFLNIDTQAPLDGFWGSFDGSTNYPVVYPSTASIAGLMNQVLIQVTPAAVPDATNGVPYTVTFSAAGGQPPYTWAAPNISTQVPNLNFNAATATVSGTPAYAGTFNFTVQVTDSANRTVSLNYPITIH